MFTLDQVLPWGRSFDEYRSMLALTEPDIRMRIIGCGDGLASFNAEATRRGARVISTDPIYRWEMAQIRDRIAATCDDILDQTRQNAEEFVWDSIRSVEELGQVRIYDVSIETVPYEFQRGGNQMMRIRRMSRRDGAGNREGSPS